MNHPLSMMGTVSDPTPTPTDPAPADPGAPPTDPTPPPAPEPTPPVDEAKVSMTQAELDALIAKRVDKAKRQTADEANAAAERAKMDDLERAQAEKADAEQRATDALAKANGILVKAEAKVAATGAGVKADRVDAFLRTIDLSDIEVGDDGTVDAKALAKVINDGLTAVPEFKAPAGAPPSGGGDFNGAQPPTKATDLTSAVEKRLAAAGR